jgi:hypothetical protein
MNLEERIAVIEQRNIKVEKEKAWETSLLRAVALTILTYVIMILVFWKLGNTAPFQNAIVPTLGFILSTQSLPFIKHWWIKRYHS